jgi:O-antigen/teichoic acid export membrane protein
MKDPTARRNVLATSRDGLYVLAVTFAIALTAASPLILQLWAPPSYHPRSLLLITALVAASALPYADAVIYNQVLIVAGRTRAVAVGAVAMALLNLVLNLALVPVLGIEGSAGITFCCYLAGALRYRWLAGGAGPRTNLRPLLLSSAGVVLCIASAAVPPFGLALVLRLLVALAATAAFFIQLVTLIRPQARRTLRLFVVRLGERITQHA